MLREPQLEAAGVMPAPRQEQPGVAAQERQADRRRQHRDVAAGARIRSRETAGPRA